jgi:hypothetical protein
MNGEKPSPKELRANLDTLPLWPEFRQDSSSVDGLIPTCRVESWEEFAEAMRDPTQNRASREWAYRGQRGGDWPLASTLGRKFDGGSIPASKRAALLREFELAMRGRGYDLSAYNGDDSDIEKWAIGQHNGLLTPLLDWTRSPFIALFFAFSTVDDPEKNPSRAIYCVNMSALREQFDDNGQPLFREPMGHNNSRLVNQAGLFTMIADDDDNFASYVINSLINEGVVSAEPITELVDAKSETSGEAEVQYEIKDNLADQLKDYIQKIHIPNEGRTGCLAMLRKMNIHNGTLFPDAQGASLYCNDWLDRVLAEELKEQDLLEKIVKSAAATLKMKELVETSVDDVSGIKAILDGLLADTFSESEREDIAKKLHNRFIQDRSFEWFRSTNKTAKVKTGQRRLVAAFGVLESQRETLIEELMKIYIGRAGEESGT